MTVSEEMCIKTVINFKVSSLRWALVQGPVCVLKEKIDKNAKDKEKQPHEDTSRRWSSTHEERPSLCITKCAWT